MKKKGLTVGVNITEGGTIDMQKLGVFDLLMTKLQGLRLITDVVTTILRVDQIIMSKPSGGPKPKKEGHWDDKGDD